jgi:hypothetical protein
MHGNMESDKESIKASRMAGQTFTNKPLPIAAM